MSRAPGSDLSVRSTGKISFGLNLVERRGVITLTHPQSRGPLTIEELDLEIPGIRFPFDLSGGASQFQHRRCKLLRSRMSGAERDVLGWLRSRAAASAQDHGIEIQSFTLHDVTFEIVGAVSEGDQKTMFLVQGAILPTRGSRIQICLFDIRLYGASALAAPAVAGNLLLSLGATRDVDSRAYIDGCCDVLFDPLSEVLLWTLPPAGWRLPSLSRAVLSEVLVDQDREHLVLTYSTTDSRLRKPRQVTSEWPTQLLSQQSAKDRFRSAEAQILEAPGDALASYQGLVEDDPHEPFLLTRLLQLSCADPSMDEETARLVQKATDLDPEFIPALLSGAALHLRQGRPLEAAKIYRQISQLSGEHRNGALLATLAAGMATRGHELALARSDFERALDIDPSNAVAIGELVKLYAESGQWEQLIGVRQLELTLEEDPARTLHTRLALGELYRVHIGNSRLARAEYERALEVDSSCEPALKGIAQACIDTEDLAIAIQAMEQLSQIYHQRQDYDEEFATHLRVASLLEHLDDHGGALQRVDHALKLRVDDAEALKRKASLLVTLGRREEAAHVLTRVLPGLSDHIAQIEIHQQLTQMWLSLGSLGEARKQLDLSMILNPDDPTTLKLAVDVAEAAEDADALSSALDRAARAERNSMAKADLLLRRGVLLAEQDSRIDEAAESLERALQEGLPEDRAKKTWDQIIELQRDRHGPETAARTSETAAATYADERRKADQLFHAGEIWFKEVNSVDDAVRCYSAAIASWSHHGPALDALESIHTARDDRSSLVKILQLKIESLTSQPAIQKALLVRRGEVLIDLDRAEEAHPAFTQALGLDGEYTPALLHLARAASAAGQPRQAEEYYRRLTSSLARAQADQAPVDRVEVLVESHLQLAALCRSDGRSKEEEGHIEMALAVNPRHSQGLERLDALLTEQDRPGELVEVLRRRCDLCREKEAAITLRLRLAGLLESIPDRFSEATRAYRMVLELNPDHESALTRLTQLLRQGRRFSELVLILEQRAEVAEREEDKASHGRSLWIEAAKLCEDRLSDRDRATRYLLRALRLVPEDEQILDGLLRLSGGEGLEGLDPEILFGMARQHRDAGRLQRATRAVRAAIELSPPGERRAAAARELLTLSGLTGQEQDAATALLALRGEDPSPDELWQLARLLAGDGQLAEAVEIIATLPSDHAARDEICSVLWQLLEELGRFEELARDMEARARRMTEPIGRRELLLRAARTWIREAGQFEAARAPLLEAASMEPLDLGVVEQIGGLLHEIGEVDELDAIVRKLIDPDGMYTSANQARIICRWVAFKRSVGGSWRDAEEGYLLALERDPNSAAAMDGLISLYTDRADHDKLVAMLTLRAEKSSDLSRRVESLLRASKILNEDLHRADESLPLLERARVLQPDDSDILEALADIHLGLGDVPRAEDILLTLADTGSSPARALERACGLARLRGDVEAEALYLSRLAEERPDDAKIAARLAAAVKKIDDPVQQCAVLDRLSRTDREMMVELARVQAESLHDLEASRSTLKRLLDHQPDHLAGLAAMTQVCEALNRTVEVASCLKRLVRLEPRDHRRQKIAIRLANLEDEAGNLEDAEQALRRAIEAVPDDPAVIDLLANNLRRQKRWTDLCKLLEAEFTRGALPPDVHGRLATQLGEVYMDQLDDLVEGSRWLEVACGLSPASDLAFKRLLSLHRHRQDHDRVAELLKQRIDQVEGEERGEHLEALGYVQEMHLRDPGRAALSYAAAFEESPGDRIHCAVQAQELFTRANELESAMALLDQIMTRVDRPTRGELHASRARILMIRDRTLEAITEYERALSHNPHLFEVHAALGRQLFAQGKYNAATPHLRTAAENLDKPKEREACAVLARRALEKLGVKDTLPGEAAETGTPDPPRAAQAPFATTVEPAGDSDEGDDIDIEITTAGDLQPPEEADEVDMSPDDWQRLLDAYVARADDCKDPRGRAELLMQAARITEDKLSKTLDAEALYDRAVAVKPDHIPAIEALADVTYRNQNWHKARDLYDDLRERGQSTYSLQELSFRRALIYESLGDDGTAVRCYTQTIALDPDHRPALEGMVRMAQRRDDIDGAIEALTGLSRLITIDEIDALSDVRVKLGELHLLKGDLSASREYLEASLTLDPQQKKVIRTLITVYQHMGEFEAMVDLLQQLICITDNPLVRASLLHYLGEVLGMELDDEQAAIDCLLKAFDLSPSYPPTLWRLIDYYWEKSDLESVAEMGTHLMESIDLDKDPPNSRHIRLAVALLMSRDDPDTAARLLRLALTSDELWELCLLDLAHAISLAVPLERVLDLIAAADVAGILASAASGALEAHPAAPGLHELVMALVME